MNVLYSPEYFLKSFDNVIHDERVMPLHNFDKILFISYINKENRRSNKKSGFKDWFKKIDLNRFYDYLKDKRLNNYIRDYPLNFQTEDRIEFYAKFGLPHPGNQNYSFWCSTEKNQLRVGNLPEDNPITQKLKYFNNFKNESPINGQQGIGISFQGSKEDFYKLFQSLGMNIDNRLKEFFKIKDFYFRARRVRFSIFNSEDDEVAYRSKDKQDLEKDITIYFSFTLETPSPVPILFLDTDAHKMNYQLTDLYFSLDKDAN
jgi:hypothetical protein